MAYIFRPTRVKTLPDGRKKKSKDRKWYAAWRDPATNRWHRRAGYEDARATRALADRLQLEADRRHEGLIDPLRDHVAVPLDRHLADYLAYLDAKGDSAAHVKLTGQRARDLAAGCRWSRIGHMAPDAVVRWLGEQRRVRVRFGVQTSNHYLRAVKGFSAWLVFARRSSADPLASLSTADPRSDPRHQRRALPQAEFDRLLEVTEASVKTGRNRLTGRQRALLYAVAAYTGLRASELASLRPRDLDLSCDVPKLTILPQHEKNRKGQSVPLHPFLVKRLRTYLADYPPDLSLWPGGWARNKHGAAMLRGDLAAAGIPYRDQRGRVFDFHALRLQFVTGLARAGVPLQAAQKLARHSTPVLTSNVYSALEDDDLAAEVGRLPTPQPAGAHTKPPRGHRRVHGSESH